MNFKKGDIVKVWHPAYGAPDKKGVLLHSKMFQGKRIWRLEAEGNTYFMEKDLELVERRTGPPHPLTTIFK